ncbi:trypsin-like peptidase domain-containing protein [Streptomyces tauricus]|uniref:Trypsin-like peptidase domain-containing protein n=1 Tax=Streptomyces tauricus TaxID=68274 RepID=A0ABZ1J779_9ACTN|nr:trypsin-like peptidase domain-containing protein [Streptomyces tauricus]
MTTRSERGMRPERTAEIIVSMPAGGGGGRRGSGYLVASGTVLTAAHVVAGADGIRVRFQAGRPGERVVDAELAWSNDAVDVAVLTLPETAAEDVPPVSLGRIDEQDTVLSCTAMGFPRFKLRTDAAGRRFRDAEHMDASCAVLANRREGTLDLRITAPPAEDPDPARDAWEGMSGAAVFSGAHLVGVVSRHHRREGPGRIAAGRVDRWADALSASERARLESLLGHDLMALPTTGPAAALDLVQEAYRAQLTDIAPELLDRRESELADLVSFCGGPEPYLWLQGRPWAGKTALAAWFALRPPRGVVPVWFFITARYAGQSDSDAYTAAVVEQLAAIVGREPAVAGSPAARDGERRLLLREAAERVAEDGGTLLLVVDGLDEDQSRVPGGAGTSIASLLPGRLPPNVRVLVTSRPNPGIPPDVTGGHPLRHCPVVELATSEAARHTEHEAKFDLQQALAGDRLERDVVGLLTAARGTLSIEDLRELTGETGYSLRQKLGSVFGRILRLRGGGIGGSGEADVTLYTTSRGYLFAHETLLVAARDELGPDVDTYWERLRVWAETYERRGWPESTPLYLLQPYGRLVAFLQDAGRATALATDLRRRNRLREATGSDAACLAEIAAARETVRRVTPDDLGALGALAAAEDLVARRNESLHPDIPAGYARLGRVRHALGLARSVFRTGDRARAVLGVARVLAETGDSRTAGLAEEAARLAERAMNEAASGRTGGLPAAQGVWAAQGLRATALVLAGREEEAVRGLREKPRAHDGPGAKAFVGALITTAGVLRDPAAAAGLLRLAEESAELIEFLPDRVRVLAALAETCAACGLPDDATRLYGEVAELAGCRDTSDFENLYAITAEALRDTRPEDAERLARMPAAQPRGVEHVAGHGGGHGAERGGWHGADGKATCGDVCALVAAGRMTEAHRLAEHIGNPGRLRAQRVVWSVVAEGWARRGSATEAWAAREQSRRAGVLDGDIDDTTQRVVESLVRAGADASASASTSTGVGAAEQLVAALVAQEYSAPDGPSWWEAAEVLAVLAGHLAATDPQRALELLHTAEHGPPRTATKVAPTVDQERLAALAGALATAGRPDEAERLVTAISEPSVRAWGLAAVSLAVAATDPGRALRLSEAAVDLSSELDEDWATPSPMATAVQALAWAGAGERVADILRAPAHENAPPGTYDRDRARVEAAGGLWAHDPSGAARLVNDLLGDVLDGVPGGASGVGRDSVLPLVRLLVAVGPHDGELGARVRQVLHSPAVLDPSEDVGTGYRGHDGLHPASREVLLSLLTATTDPTGARRRLDGIRRYAPPRPGGARAVSGSALVHAALGDHESAWTMAARGEDAEQRATAFAHLAAYAALLPGDRVPVPVPLHDPSDVVLLARRLATLLFPPPAGPDLPRARGLLAEALSPEGWQHALPVLAAIDPDAVLRVRDVVFAHLGFDA